MGRKGKAVPASSAKALEVCGDTSCLGVSAADIFAQFQTPDIGVAAAPAAPAVKGAEDTELSISLQSLQKKDPTTRCRAVTELKAVLTARESASLREACVPFLNAYRRAWPFDAEPRVREGLQRCLQVLVSTMQRDFQRHLRSAFPTWLCAMFDTHTEVAQAARQTFSQSFSTDEKRRGVFRHCQNECLDTLAHNLRHSEQSLHDELGIPSPQAGDRNTAVERQDRYVRVIAASLHGLGELVHVCSAPPAPGSTASSYEPLSEADIAHLFGNSGAEGGLWHRLSAKQSPLVRRAATECLIRILQSPAAKGADFARSQHRSTIINALADEAVPTALAATLLCSFVEASGPECWEGLTASKSLWPQLLSAVKRGAREDAAFVDRLPKLLSALPESAWGAGRGEAILQPLLHGLSAPRAPVSAILKAFPSVLMAIDAAGITVGPEWRWAPLELYLGGPAAASNGSGTGPESLPAIPAAALRSVPAAVASEWSSLLEAQEASSSFLEVLSSSVPPVPAAKKSEQVQPAGQGCWSRWLEVVACLLAESSRAPPDVKKKVAELASTQLTALLVAGASWPIDAERDLADAFPLLECIGDFLKHGLLSESALKGLEQEGSLQELPRSAGQSNDDSSAFAEVQLLSWPLLPWWQRWLSLDRPDALQAAQTFGRHVINPLLFRALDMQAQSFPCTAVREMIAAALLDDAATSGDSTKTSQMILMALDCIPERFEFPKALRCEQVLLRLASQCATGDINGEAALRAALRPSLANVEVVRSCLVSLTSAQTGSGSPQLKPNFEAAVLAATILSKYTDSRLAADAGFGELQGPLCAALLTGLVHDRRGSSGAAPSEAETWAFLQQLVPGVDTSILAAALSETPEAPSVRSKWVRAVAEASKANGSTAIALLTQARCSTGTQLQQRGALRRSDLKRNALATVELLSLLGPQGVFSGEEGSPAEQQDMLLWEILLGHAVGVCGLPPAVLTWLGSRPVEDLKRCVRFCIEESAFEGSSWWLDGAMAEDEKSAMVSLPLPVRLHGITALRSLLRVAAKTSASSQLSDELVSLALELSTKEAVEKPAWGLTLAEVLGSFGAARGADSASAAAAQAHCSSCQSKLLTDLSSKDVKVEPTRLYALAAIERWARGVKAADAEEGANERDSDDEEPEVVVIKEADPGAKAQVAHTPVAEDLDTHLLELQNPLLRWAQGDKSVSLRGDAFASFMAAIWPSLPASERTTAAPRMVRHVLELLAEAQKASLVWTSPGALQLVEALCRTNSWPPASWAPVLAAVSDSSSMALDVGMFARAFAEDAVTSACSVLAFVPETAIQKVVPLLSSTDPDIRTASAARLRTHRWVPKRSADVTDDRNKKILQEFTELLQKKEDEKGEAPDDEVESRPAPAAGDPTCEDVVYSVLGSVLGPDLNEHIWAVQDALHMFMEWEDEVEEESESDDEADQGDGGDPTEVITGSSPAASSKDPGRKKAVKSDTGQGRVSESAPPEHLRRCFATLAAWELLLLGVQSQEEILLESKSLQGECAHKLEAPQVLEPAELLSRALQLSGSEQLPSASSSTSSGIARIWAGSSRSIWTIADAPRLSRSVSPLLPLIRLVCCILGSGSLSAGNKPIDRFAAEAARVLVNDSDIVPPMGRGATGMHGLEQLAVRVLALALRNTPAAVRSFWEALPRRARERVEKIVASGFSPHLCQVEASTSSQLLDANKDGEELSEIEASIVRRGKQLVLQLQREDINFELYVQMPDSFPLRQPVAELPEKVPGIPRNRLRGWLLQARQVFSGQRPMTVGTVMVMWARSFALFFNGVEDCPICYNVVELTTGTIPKKSCPTCKKKFHSECLHQWFKSSSKTTCPLCNQPFIVDKKAGR